MVKHSVSVSWVASAEDFIYRKKQQHKKSKIKRDDQLTENSVLAELYVDVTFSSTAIKTTTDSSYEKGLSPNMCDGPWGLPSWQTHPSPSPNTRQISFLLPLSCLHW